MKSYGDIPEESLFLAEELKLMEHYLLQHKDELTMLNSAKGYVCIAHDYYSIDFEEEGDRLIIAADKLCPGYFKGPIYSQTNQDPYFYCLVDQLVDSLGLDLMKSLGFDEKQI